jgi:hypothetical protein
MLRPVQAKDLETMRLARNKWYKLGIFRQDHAITKDEQKIWWHDRTQEHGYIINERAWGRVLADGEISFYGFDEWHIGDIFELMEKVKNNTFYGECYLNNPYLTIWLIAGYKVIGYKRNRKYWNNRMWDSLLLEWSPK